MARNNSTHDDSTDTEEEQMQDYDYEDLSDEGKTKYNAIL